MVELLDTAASSPAALASWVEADMSLIEHAKLPVGLGASLTKCPHQKDMSPLEVLLRQMGSRIVESALPGERTFSTWTLS